MSNTIYVFPRWTMSDLREKVGLRLRTEDLQLLKRVCEARGECASVFIRRATKTELARLGFLSAMEKRALEITTQEVTPE